ncbi:hypothetical protein Q4508_03870 [Amphritea sp. 2_MG-2023]|jgi:hypothetical protein|uniref:hypothetical protein n=1 Tax=Amphritea TaxID=515417 RepID=UPI001C076E38|nr:MULTISPECIES: hypothetical protein [Amphritea]MBU2966451.1 hypothetical protein [Amphritea atlantica]MDO6417690.1 hypothetical protein [Amphritea sp. 2_MG-2023]MDX2422531.1 hypothetical protein [Amphritea sp.]
MLTYEECLHLSDLTEDEVEAIAEHEHTDPIIAMAMGHYLCCHKGESKVKKIILDDIAKAQRKGDKEHERVLRHVLTHFIRTHPSHHGKMAKVG